MKVSTLLKLQEEQTYLLATRGYSSENITYYLLKRYSDNHSREYYMEDKLFWGSIRHLNKSFNDSSTTLYVELAKEEEYPYNKTTELTGCAGSYPLSISGNFCIYNFDFVGVYNKDTIEDTIKKYELHSKIYRKMFYINGDLNIKYRDE